MRFPVFSLFPPSSHFLTKVPPAINPPIHKLPNLLVDPPAGAVYPRIILNNAKKQQAALYQQPAIRRRSSHDWPIAPRMRRTANRQTTVNGSRSPVGRRAHSICLVVPGPPQGPSGALLSTNVDTSPRTIPVLDCLTQCRCPFFWNFLDGTPVTVVSTPTPHLFFHTRSTHGCGNLVPRYAIEYKTEHLVTQSSVSFILVCLVFSSEPSPQQTISLWLQSWASLVSATTFPTPSTPIGTLCVF